MKSRCFDISGKKGRKIDCLKNEKSVFEISGKTKNRLFEKLRIDFWKIDLLQYSICYNIRFFCNPGRAGLRAPRTRDPGRAGLQNSKSRPGRDFEFWWNSGPGREAKFKIAPRARFWILVKFRAGPGNKIQNRAPGAILNLGKISPPIPTHPHPSPNHMSIKWET